MTAIDNAAIIKRNATKMRERRLNELQTVKMNITVYTKSNCPNCTTAKQLLKAKGIRFGEVDAEKPGTMEALAMLHPVIRQMPAIFIDGQFVGGLAGLQAALKQVGL